MLRRIALVVVPCAALCVWLAIARGERMAPPPDRFFLPALVYDEFDFTAMAQRGLNAELGRQAGAPTRPGLVDYDDFSSYLTWEHERQPRYFLEYPHAMLILFRAGYWIQPGWRTVPIPAILPDCDYQNIASHDPQTDGEMRVWKLFVNASRLYVSVMFAAFLLLILVLEWGYGPGTGLHGGSLLLLLPAALFFALNRYDVLPAVLTALAFALLGRRFTAIAAVALGLATLAKLYPVLFAPLVLRYLWSDRREAVRFGGFYAMTCSLALTPLLFGADWQALIGPYKFQLTRPPEHGMILYGCVLPGNLSSGTVGTLFRLLCLGSVMSYGLGDPIRDMPSLLRRCALVLLVFVNIAVFYSPQWVLWFAPLLLPLAARDRRLGWGVALLDVLTYITFPVWFIVLPQFADEYLKPLPYQVNGKDMGYVVLNHMGNVLRFVRFLLCVYIGWRLLRADFRRLTPDRHHETPARTIPAVAVGVR